MGFIATWIIGFNNCSSEKQDKEPTTTKSAGKATGEQIKIVAPFSGEVTLVADTRHAVGLRSDDGIDTVELKGQAFISHVKKGDHVNQGDLLMEMDVAAIAAAGYDPVVLSIVTNTNDYIDVISTVDNSEIIVGDNIMAVIK
ncbi:PTS glucose transporter subunit IIA [Lactobacillus sp. ESL0785]|uniref:PTS sugar transporter subunit IIA n=1 Tax=Lactobacillus sp. ESL0785 TaxID=2983232 RepID=UPI0023F8BEE4|nr:PTS glucose transporter subunit IIA [Lactobacillus sp. ESL0785]WEV70729.1 PTS glucose transporter subunit IIA [Lactobacillus sp. ESL0785]